MRDNTTYDTEAYREMFDFPDNTSNIEYGFIALIKWFRELSVNFHLFLLTCTSLLFITWHFCTKQLVKNILISFSIFIPYTGLYIYGITLRTAIACSIMLIGYTYLLKHLDKKGLLVYLISVTFALFFHNSMAVAYLLPVLLLLMKMCSKKVLYIICLFNLILPFYSSSIHYESMFSPLSAFFSHYESYIDRSIDFDSGYSLRYAVEAIIAFVAIFYRDKIAGINIRQYNVLLYTYLIGSTIASIVSGIPAGTRLALVFLFFRYLLLAFLYEYISPKYKMRIFLFLILIFIIDFLFIIRLVPSYIN